MAKRRTPAEILADLENQRNELLARVAMEDAKSNPKLADILNEIESKRKQSARIQSGFSTGTNNFADRIAKHQNWIDEIKAQEALAKAERSQVEKELAYLQNALTLAANDEVDPDTVIENMPEVDEDIQELRDAVDEATALRKNFAAELKKPKRKVKEVEQTVASDESEDDENEENMEYAEA